MNIPRLTLAFALATALGLVGSVLLPPYSVRPAGVPLMPLPPRSVPVYLPPAAIACPDVAQALKVAYHVKRPVGFKKPLTRKLK